MTDAEKLEWLGREFGPTPAHASEEDLPDFAALCLLFFGGHVHGAVPQKALVFRLFTDFVGGRIKLEKEADVSPPVREELGPLWGVEDAQLCHECGRDLRFTQAATVEDLPSEKRHHWCSASCALRYKDRSSRSGSELLPPPREPTWKRRRRV